MNQYTIYFTLSGSACLDVIAETREEAFAKAAELKRTLTLDDSLNSPKWDMSGDFRGKGPVDWPGLREQAESILRGDQGRYIDVEGECLSATVRRSDGDCYVYRNYPIMSAYWEERYDEISVELDGGCDDTLLSELREYEQYALCKAIVEEFEKENNGKV